MIIPEIEFILDITNSMFSETFLKFKDESNFPESSIFDEIPSKLGIKG